MASGANYGYDQPEVKRQVDPTNAGYDQPSNPPGYTPYGNPQQQGHYPMQGQGYYPPPTSHNNVNVVMTQPQTSTVIINQRPNDYLGWSIFTLLCCCLPIGIAAVIFSSNSKAAADSMDFRQAHKDADIARMFNIIGLVVGLLFITVMIDHKLHHPHPEYDCTYGK